jgi:hypothetical protein
VHEEEKTPPQLTQGILFQETESEIITLENCQAISTAAVQTVRGKKEWTCTFMALPDLWHQDRNEIVYARAREEDKIRAASHTRLQPLIITHIFLETPVELIMPQKVGK